MSLARRIKTKTKTNKQTKIRETKTKNEWLYLRAWLTNKLASNEIIKNKHPFFALLSVSDTNVPSFISLMLMHLCICGCFLIGKMYVSSFYVFQWRKFLLNTKYTWITWMLSRERARKEHIFINKIKINFILERWARVTECVSVWQGEAIMKLNGMKQPGMVVSWWHLLKGHQRTYKTISEEKN